MLQRMAECRSLVRRTSRVERSSETMAADVREGLLRRPLRDRWCSHGLYADESWIRDVLASGGLAIASLERIRTVHLHCLVVARKVS